MEQAAAATPISCLQPSFGLSYGSTFVGAVNWLLSCDRESLVCANELYKLLHVSSPVTWRREDFEAFLSGLIDYWNQGG